jgi:hypothetical protein
MQHAYAVTRHPSVRGTWDLLIRFSAALLLVAAWLLPVATTSAQTPSWSAAGIGSSTQGYGTSEVRAVTADASGNVFVTGMFTGTVAFGSTSLTSQGDDLFVAKYVPSTSTWAWAQRYGGTGYEAGQGIAVSGTSVYVTGYTTNTNNVSDFLLAKYTDNGSTATLSWTQVGMGGGISASRGNGIAASGTSIYVTTSNGNLLVAKYTDNGSSVALGWTQAGGGTDADAGLGIAVSGTSVYVTGYITNTNADAKVVRFGGTPTTAGTARQNGASTTLSKDLVLAKYTDNGSSGSLKWTHVGGGTGNDVGQSIAVNGTNVYVTGYINNSSADANVVRFGGTGTTAGTARQNGASATASDDLLVAKYTDNGTSATLGWTQVGGGSNVDTGRGIAVSGTSVFVTGQIINNTADATGVRFGGTGTTAGTVVQLGASTAGSTDLLVAKYTDNGSTATLNLTRVGGGSGDDQGAAIVVNGSNTYIAGFMHGDDETSPAFFDPQSSSPVIGTSEQRAVLGALSITDGLWQRGTTASNNGGTSEITAVTTDASGNVFVTGSFTGIVSFGSTTLLSMGSQDFFVAKYLPGTGTWAWALSSLETGAEKGQGIAVSGGNVYVTGYRTFNAETNRVIYKFADQGSSARKLWMSMDNYAGNDEGLGIAVSGTSVYVTGYVTSANNDYDLTVAKYTDTGTNLTFNWAQMGGGMANDVGRGIAVSGTNVYVTGYIENGNTDFTSVRFGGAGTTTQWVIPPRGPVVQNGTTATDGLDLLVAKYTDNGSTGTFNWAQVGGGDGADEGAAIAVSGTNLYVTGYITNDNTDANAVRFGGSGTTAGTARQYGASATTSSDVVVAKYTDNGSTGTFNWAQVGGGADADQGAAIAVNGTGVYITGYINNDDADGNTVRFGGTGTTAGTVPQKGMCAFNSSIDLLVAKYTDNGSTAALNWAQAGGGDDVDEGRGIAVSGTSVFVGGSVIPAATFGSFTINSPGFAPTNFLGLFAQAATPLPVELVRFTAEQQGPAALLRWTTAQEKNNDHFDVYASADGQTFRRLGAVAGHGTTTSRQEYRFVDEQLARYGAPVVYYRLRQVDRDGTAADSPVRAVRVTVASATLTLVPNPARATATLRGAASGAPVQLLDGLGRVCLTATADASGTAALPLPPALPAGVYLVRSGRASVRLVKE